MRISSIIRIGGAVDRVLIAGGLGCGGGDSSGTGAGGKGGSSTTGDGGSGGVVGSTGGSAAGGSARSTSSGTGGTSSGGAPATGGAGPGTGGGAGRRLRGRRRPRLDHPGAAAKEAAAARRPVLEAPVGAAVPPARPARAEEPAVVARRGPRRHDRWRRCRRRDGRQQRLGPADGLGVLEQLRRQDQLQRHQGASGRHGVERPQGRRLSIRQHRRGLVAGNARRLRQHHRRHDDGLAGRDAGHRDLHPWPRSQGRDLHRRRQGWMRLLLPDGTSGGAGLRQRGALRSGLSPVLEVGLRFRQGRLVRRQLGGAQPANGVSSNQQLHQDSHGADRTADGVLGLRLGQPEPLELGARHVHHVAHEPGHHLLWRAGRSEPRPHQLRFGATPHGANPRALQRSGHAHRRDAEFHRRAKPDAHGVVGNRERAAPGGQQSHDDDQRHQERLDERARSSRSIRIRSPSRAPSCPAERRAWRSTTRCSPAPAGAPCCCSTGTPRRQRSPFDFRISAWARPLRCGTSGWRWTWGARRPATASASPPTIPSCCSSPTALRSSRAMRQQPPRPGRQRPSDPPAAATSTGQSASRSHRVSRKPTVEPDSGSSPLRRIGGKMVGKISGADLTITR